jgi:hypothetical protein
LRHGAGNSLSAARQGTSREAGKSARLNCEVTPSPPIDRDSLTASDPKHVENRKSTLCMGGRPARYAEAGLFPRPTAGPSQTTQVPYQANFVALIDLRLTERMDETEDNRFPRHASVARLNCILPTGSHDPAGSGPALNISEGTVGPGSTLVDSAGIEDAFSISDGLHCKRVQVAGYGAATGAKVGPEHS